MYSAFAIEKRIRTESSSGGIAWLLAERAVELGYGICGVTYNYKEKRAEHKNFFELDGMRALKGSKYLQSICEPAFQDVLKELQFNCNRRFIIFGTPCQIAGINHVLIKKELRKRVALVDIFCHGTPSYLLWQKYWKWLDLDKGMKEGKKMILTFRDKTYSWHKYFMHITSTSKNEWGGVKEYLAEADRDPFLKLFTLGVVNQEACFTCPYRNQTAADIRLGDYWGPRFESTEEGVSMILVNTEIGRNLMDGIKEKINYFEQDIKERFGQQHTDYQYPKYYDASLMMLRDDRVRLNSIIDLYENGFDRFKKQVKVLVEKLLKQL